MPEIADKSDGQKGAEAVVESQRKDLGPFVVAAESTRMPMVFTNALEPHNRIIFANDSFLALTGYDREEVLGQDFDFLLAEDGAAEARLLLDAAFDGRAEDVLDLQCRHKDGRLFWVATFIGPVRDETGAVMQHFVSFLDLTRHKREEEHLRFLLDELNHRTQNTLATVMAIAGQTLRGATDRVVIDAFEGRILALSQAHSLLGREKWLAVGLRDVADQILSPFGLRHGGADRIEVAGKDVRLSPKAALTLAMVFHELATNAAKYGALSNEAGVVRLSWEVEGPAAGGRIRLRWEERDGPPVTPPGRAGFGSRLIERGLAQELEGEVHLDYAPAGLVCRIDMPAPAKARG